MLQNWHSMKQEILPLEEFQRIYPQNKESPGGTSPCPQMSSSPPAPVSLWVWGANTSDEESCTAAVQVNKPNSGWCRLNTTKGSTSLRKIANPSKKPTFSSQSTCNQCITFQLRGTPTRKLLPNLPDLEGTKLEWNVKGENTTTITWMSSRSCHSWTNPHGLWKHPCQWVANPSPKNFYTPIQMFILLFATRPNMLTMCKGFGHFRAKNLGWIFLSSRIWTMKSPTSNNIP